MTPFHLLMLIISIQGHWDYEKSVSPYDTPHTYFVSPEGNDSNPGRKIEEPLRTISAAATKMEPGDTCFIRGGIYRETIEIKGRDLTFKNYKNEKVTVSGLDVVKNWVPFDGQTYSAYFKPSDKENNLSMPRHLGNRGGLFTQVFADSEPMEISKFPNQPGDLLHWETHGTPVTAYVDGTFKFEAPGATEIPPPSLEGGIFHAMVDKKFGPLQGVVDGFNGDSFRCSWRSEGWRKSTPDHFVKYLFTAKNGGVPTGRGRGFIAHHLAAIDKEKEWYWDKRQNKLYLRPPKGKKPSQMIIEAKSRINAFVINFSQNIVINGIDIKAAGVELNNSTHCRLDHMDITYPVPFYMHNHELGGYVTVKIKNGSNNKFTNSRIAHSWGSGMTVELGTDHEVSNCIIEDVNWMGNYNACINVGGRNTRVVNNVLRKSGRFILWGIGVKKGWIAYNDMYDCMKIGQDGGVFYTNGALGDSTVIAYNWIHEVHGITYEDSNRPNHNIAIGVYLDGGCRDFLIHHNVIWGMEHAVILSPGRNGKLAQGNIITNNTCYVYGKGSIVTFNQPGMYKANVYKNNLTNKKIGALGEKSGNHWDQQGKFMPLLFTDGTFNKGSLERAGEFPSAGAYDKPPFWVPGLKKREGKPLTVD